MARPTNAVRKLSKTGRSQSLSITIPAEIVRALDLREHQRMLVKKISGVIVIPDAKTKKKK
jgi:antitoxin component of MazEF toxin-antitoxin module